MKLALIFSKMGPERFRYGTIVKNLLAVYKLSFPDSEIRTFDYSSRHSGCENLLTAFEMKKFSPDKIVFIDHGPHPLNLVRKLQKVFHSRHLPPLYIHAYGEFPLYEDNLENSWAELSNNMIGQKICIICSSEAHKNYVAQFFNNAESFLATCPFPVDEEKFFYSKEIRRSWRDKLGLQEGEIAVAYSGSLGLQKNITVLIERLAKCKEFKGGRLKLFLAGNFDDLGLPLFGVHFHEGHYFQLCSDVIRKLPSAIRENVYFLGGVPQKELNGIFNACDIYCGLSLQHDEDHALGPLEALATGLPILITDWRSNSDLHKLDKRCHLIRTFLGRSNLEIDFDDFSQHFQRLIGQMEQQKVCHREETREACLKVFSMKSVAEKLRKLLEFPLGGLDGVTEKMEFLSFVLLSLNRFHRAGAMSKGFPSREGRTSLKGDMKTFSKLLHSTRHGLFRRETFCSYSAFAGLNFIVNLAQKSKDIVPIKEGC